MPTRGSSRGYGIGGGGIAFARGPRRAGGSDTAWRPREYAHGIVMDFDAFAARAGELADSFPPEFVEEIETVAVHRDVKPHPHVPDVFTLGQCATSHLSDPTGQEPFRSVIDLYYGSFVELAKQDPDFDMEAELAKTIEHEIQHHLEDRAGIHTLCNEDALFEAHARFRNGLDVPPGWYRLGEMLEPGLWAVDIDLFLELELRKKDWNGLVGTRLVLTVLDDRLEVDVPADTQPEEIWTFEGEGLLEDGAADDEIDEVEKDEADEDLGEDDLQDDDEGDEEDEPDGLVGDLHVVPVVR